jgi:7-cyano-7-deazaguanine synthase
VESAALLRWSLDRFRRVTPLYIRTGARWETAELRQLHRLVAAFRAPRLSQPIVLDVPVEDLYGRHWSLTGRGVPGAATPDAAVYLPGRNLLLLAKAAVYGALTGLDTLLLGTLKGNPFPDATPTFFATMTRAIQHGLGVPLRIETPFRTLGKADVIRTAGHIPWVETWSCLRPIGARHCGDCNKCAERRRAFAEAGIADPTRYAARARL